jgi:phospholipid/cholesterol/gamma-HCH transport system substrate-binding protein
MNTKENQIFWLGVFIIGAVALAAWLLLFLRPSFGDGDTELRVRFTNIERVSVGTRVTYAGKPVGEVVAINEIFDAREHPTNANGDYYFYELVLKVDSSVKIYSFDKIAFTTTGLFGEKSVALIPKAPPSGQHAKEITTDILYASPSGDLEQAISQLAGISGVLETTLKHMDHLVTTIEDPLKQMLVSLTGATDQLAPLLNKANQADLIGQVTTTFSKVSGVMQQVLESNLINKLGEGATEFVEIGGRFNDDGLYCQISAVLCELHRLINDINNYGLLFQYNKRWQRKQLQRNCY